MSGYIGTQPVPQATQKRQAFTATAGQTTFATSGYSVGFVDVYMNGVKLAAADYTATNGSDVVLASAALVNDIIEIVAFTSFVASGGLAATNNLSDVASASTALTNLGVTSTAAELNTLDAVPRGSIIYGNSSAATARLSKGATGTVLTAGADDISWVAASGGGEQTFTASGSITAGNIVGIKSDGTVAVCEQESSGVVDVSSGTPKYENDQPLNGAFDGTSKIVVTYTDTADSDKIKAVVGTVNGTAITFGSVVTVDSNADQSRATVAYDSNAGKFLLVWVHTPGSPDTLRAAVGTVSGTSISFGTRVDISTNADGDCIPKLLYDDYAQKTVIVYKEGSNVPCAKVLSISGTNVSAGALFYLKASNTSCVFVTAAYDSTANRTVAVYDNSSNMFCRTLEVSGTSLVGGTEVQFNNQFGYYINASYNPTVNKFIIGYYNDTATGGVLTGYHLLAGSVSGSTITLGTAVKQGVNVSSNTVYDPTTGQSYLQGANRNYYWVLSFSGNDVSIIVSNVVIDTEQYPGNVGGNLFGNSTLRIWLYRSSSTSRPVVLGQKLAAPSFVGIAKENISNGATGKITVAGGINTSVSGLTTGKQFGLPTTAVVITEISLVDPQANRIFGTALSSTSIYLDKGNLR